jgi:acetyl-CoA acetyltransferase
MRSVYICGVGMTPFGKAPESTLAGLATVATRQALADANLTADQVEMVVFGNAMAGLMTGQEMIRAQASLRDTGLVDHGAPMVSVENACASSSSGVHLARMAVGSGQVDVAVVVGAEKMTSPDRTRALRALASAVDLERVGELEAALYGDTPGGAGAERSLFMDIYADLAKRYMERSGATVEDFARVAVKSHAHGALNPLAQYRNLITVEEVLASRCVADPLTLLMCSPIGDGAAALVLCAGDAATSSASPAIRIRASALVSGTRTLGPQQPTAVQRAATQAYAEAGITPADIDVVELHDAAAPAELLVYEELGLCGHGEGPKLLADGTIGLGGRVPTNPSGGLLSRGHPVGATGCAQLVELTHQLRGTAGGRQVEHARIAVAENGGGYLGPEPAAACVTVLSVD